MDKRTEFQITPISEFKKIAKENEFFFWHFIPKNHSKSLSIQPITVEYQEGNSLDEFKKLLGIKLFQSYTEESVDFLLDMGFPEKRIWDKGNHNPLFLGFNKMRLVESTKFHCYCREGIAKIIFKTNPNFFESFLSVEKEDLK